MSSNPSMPPGWTCASLSEICELNPALDRSFIDNAAEVHFVPMAAVDEEFGGVRRAERRTYGQVKKGYTPFISGDVIIAKITPCMENGKGGVVNGTDDLAYFGSTEFHVLRPLPGIHPWWIGRFISQHSVRHAARLKMKGSAGQLRVPESFLNSLVIPLAPVAEQIRVLDRIDELFTDLSAGEAALQRLRKKLNRYRSAVLHAAVTGRLTAAWRKTHGPAAEPGDKLLARILIERRKQWEQRTLAKYAREGRTPPKNWQDRYVEPASAKFTYLPTLPIGWSWATLDQAFSIVRNGTAIVPRADAGVPILRISSVRPLKVDTSDVRYLTTTEADSAESWVEADDLFFTRYNGSSRLCGVCGRVDSVLGKLVHPDKLIKCQVIAGCIESRYVEIAANVGCSRAAIESRLRTTAGQVGVSGTDIKNTPIPLPPLPEQAAIIEAANEKLSQIDSMEGEVTRGLARGARLRQAILKAAFEGKLVSQDPANEPAAKLLKRIKAARAPLKESRLACPRRTRKMVSP
jgi:type I restriction enzyme S subunit